MAEDVVSAFEAIGLCVLLTRQFEIPERGRQSIFNDCKSVFYIVAQKPQAIPQMDDDDWSKHNYCNYYNYISLIMVIVLKWLCAWENEDVREWRCERIFSLDWMNICWENILEWIYSRMNMCNDCSRCNIWEKLYTTIQIPYYICALHQNNQTFPEPWITALVLLQWHGRSPTICQALEVSVSQLEEWLATCRLGIINIQNNSWYWILCDWKKYHYECIHYSINAPWWMCVFPLSCRRVIVLLVLSHCQNQYL